MSKSKAIIKTKDLPRFKAIFGYEGEFKKKSSLMTKLMVKSLISKAEEFGNG